MLLIPTMSPISPCLRRLRQPSLLRARSLILAIASWLIVQNCVRAETETSPPLLCSQYVGTQFVLTESCYIYKSYYGKTPHLGRYFEQVLVGDKLRPREGHEKFVGKSHQTEILGVVPQGAVLRITDVRNSISPAGNLVWFICDVIVGDKVRYAGADTYFLQVSGDGRNGKAPVLHPIAAPKKN